MKQFLLPLEPDVNGKITLGGKDFHYLARVRRLNQGESLSCRTPGGTPVLCQVIQLAQDRMVLQVLDSPAALKTEIAQWPFNLHLAQGLAKGKKIDQVIRQATEAGVASYQAITMDHCILDLGEKAPLRLERWHKIAREAFQQSGNYQLPSIETPLSLESWLKKIGPLTAESDRLGLFCHEKALVQGSIHRYCSSNLKDVFLLVGPEGGISEKETALLLNSGFKAISLGPGILRTETAAIYAVAAIQTILWEADSWVKRPQ